MAEAVWRIQIMHPLTGEWMTMKGRFAKREAAQSWLKFVKAYWHGAPGRTIAESKIKQRKESHA